jgi:hypothetical protein
MRRLGTIDVQLESYAVTSSSCSSLFQGPKLLWANESGLKQRSEDRVNDPRLPVRSRILILLRCPEARSNIDLGRNLTSKVFQLSGHADHDPYGSCRRTIKRFSSRRL